MTVWGWIKVGFGALITLIVAALGFSGRRKAKEIGEAEGRAAADRERVQHERKRTVEESTADLYKDLTGGGDSK